jgi:SAM-dependent methyltransferase
MNQQDFVALLEHPRSVDINSETMWDERANSFAAMKKTYGTQLTDKVLRYLKEKEILTKDSNVLDIGCGVGRYALPFAADAKEVTASDISGNMLQLVTEDIHRQGLTNIKTLKSDWRELTGSYDLVFASMTPVLFCLEGLRKMSALSSRFCVAARYIEMCDAIVEAFEKEGFKSNPHQGRDEAWAIFNLVWTEGYQPEIAYLERICNDPLTIDEAMARYNMQMEDKALLRERLREFINSDGMVESKSETTLALINWNIQKRHI